MKFLVLSALLALSGAANAESHDHQDHPGVTRAVIDPGGNVIGPLPVLAFSFPLCIPTFAETPNFFLAF